MADSTRATDIAVLVAEHHGPVYRYAYRLSGSAADAEDLTQQTFLAAQQHLGQLRQADRGRAWLLSIVRNCYLKDKRRRWPASAAQLEIDVEAVADDAPQAAEIDREQLQAAVDALSDDFKIVLLMFYFEDRSYREIAAELSLPIGTVMSRLSRAKRQLRGRLLPLEPPELAAPGRGVGSSRFTSEGR